MKEYTLLAVLAVILGIYLDRRSGIRLLSRGEYYVFLVVILGFKLLVNGYLTGTQIVQYNPRYFLGVRIGSIPLEDFGFGFGMIMLGVLVWEYVKRREQ